MPTTRAFAHELGLKPLTPLSNRVRQESGTLVICWDPKASIAVLGASDRSFSRSELAHKTPSTVSARIGTKRELPWDKTRLMGRGKYLAQLSKAERRKVKEGTFLLAAGNGKVNEIRHARGYTIYGDELSSERLDLNRTSLDTRRPAKSDSSTLHAFLFVVLVAIVVSWALGY